MVGYPEVDLPSQLEALFGIIGTDSRAKRCARRFLDSILAVMSSPPSGRPTQHRAEEVHQRGAPVRSWQCLAPESSRDDCECLRTEAIGSHANDLAVQYFDPVEFVQTLDSVERSET